jgi:SAM-dependent methyltransferase
MDWQRTQRENDDRPELHHQPVRGVTQQPHQLGACDNVLEGVPESREAENRERARGQGACAFISGSPEPNGADGESEEHRARPANELVTGGAQVARSCPDLYAAASTQYYRRCEIALVERYLGEARGKSVLKLDLWNEAVNTRLLQWIESRGAHVFGIDLSSATAVRARRNFAREKRNGHFAQGDIRSLPFAESSFDFVYYDGHDRARAGVRARDSRSETGAQARRNCGDRRSAQVGSVLATAGRSGPGTLQPLSVQPGARVRCIGAACRRRAQRAEGRAAHGPVVRPGVVRLADLFLHVRGLPMERLTGAATRPFEYAELRWEWARRLGYLVAVVARK